jgi:hypothetical protein
MNYILIVMVISFLSAQARPTLEQLEIKYNGWKNKSHNYLPIYEIYFGPLRDNNIKFLEIGFDSGGSAYMFEEYFTNAELHFIDINPEVTKHAQNLSNRSKLHIMNQTDEKKLHELISLVGEFDVIIDDGSHSSFDQKFTFKTLFPFIKSGGIYIIEDLHTSYWLGYGGKGSTGNPKSSRNSTTEFLKKLIDNVNFVGAYTGTASRERAIARVKGLDKEYPNYNLSKDLFETMDYYSKHIKSVHFYDSMCFIFKW